jgi:hypothetical protein
MLENLDKKDPSASVWELVGMEVRVSRADIATAKHHRQLAEESGEADLIFWTLPDGGPAIEIQRAALTAIAEHFKIVPSLLAPSILPVRLRGRQKAPTDDTVGTLSHSDLDVLPSMTIDPASANPEQDGARLAAAVQGALVHARRVKAVRWLERMKARRNYVGAGRQAASAIGSVVRSIFSRGRA